MLKMWLRFLLTGPFLLPPLAVAAGQSPPAVLGTWTGMVAQSRGSTGYTQGGKNSGGGCMHHHGDAGRRQARLGLDRAL